MMAPLERLEDLAGRTVHVLRGSSYAQHLRALDRRLGAAGGGGGADPNIAIGGTERAENNIHAGVKYARFLRDRYFSGPEIADADRLSFTLAAYNAGPRKIQRARQKAKALGLDPNRWFRHGEIAALATIGREPVRYVANVRKSYVAYRLELDNRQRRRARIETLRTQ